MFRKSFFLALALAATLSSAPAAHAQSVMSHQQYEESVECKRLADSVSFVVGETQAGARDAQIQAQMIAFRMRPLDDNLRFVAEQNAAYVTVGEVIEVTYRNCMQGMGR